MLFQILVRKNLIAGWIFAPYLNLIKDVSKLSRLFTWNERSFTRRTLFRGTAVDAVLAKYVLAFTAHFQVIY